MNNKFNLGVPSPGSYNIPSNCKRSIAVDIGANVGKVSILLSNNFLKVHSYEPIKFLSDALSDQKIENITCFNEAVSDNSGITWVIAHDNRNSGSSTIKTCYDSVIQKKHWTDTEINKVETVSLETVIERCGGHIDYLKMDCENSEFLILYNKDLSKIDYIAIEVHNQMGKDNFEKLKEWVSKTHIGFPDWNDDNQEALLTNKMR
jgi:FkbM family methyltransferase